MDPPTTTTTPTTTPTPTTTTQKRPSFVYLLEASPSGATYVGATMDVDHRLRQHNGQLKGGAHATTMRVKKGETWRRVVYVSGFPDWIAALQFEWRWKQLSRKSKLKNPLERRQEALQTLLALDRPTTKAVPYAEWHPQLHYEPQHSVSHLPTTTTTTETSS